MAWQAVLQYLSRSLADFERILDVVKKRWNTAILLTGRTKQSCHLV
jgi:hypothetical protein